MTSDPLDRSEAPLRAQALLSAQAALLDAVTPPLRGVTVGWRDGVVRLRFYFDGEISEEDREAMQVAATEVIADFPADFDLKEEIVRRDAPEPMEGLQAWAYRRKE